VGLAERSAVDAAQRIADTLEDAGMSYAIGGALALAIAGVPRGTADVDVNVFVPEAGVHDVIAAGSGGMPAKSRLVRVSNRALPAPPAVPPVQRRGRARRRPHD